MDTHDNKKLLEKCDNGIRMAIESIKLARTHSADEALTGVLNKYIARHKEIGQRSEQLLNQSGQSAKPPGFVEHTMLKLNGSVRFMQDESTENIADFVIDGCNMGVKTVSKYIKQYPGADAASLDLAAGIVRIEQSFADEIRQFL